MRIVKFNDQFAAIVELAVRLTHVLSADAVLVLLEGATEWAELKARVNECKLVVAADTPEELAGAMEQGLPSVVIDMDSAPVHERLTQALLESVAHDILKPGARVISVYSGFDVGKVDSLSYIRLQEHLGRLTARDLQSLKTLVPLETLKAVVSLAVDIGREGREGKPVGTMFVVGDARKVMSQSHSAGFDPVKGYKRQERNLRDPRVREAVKEIAQLDGAFVVAADGAIEGACRIIDTAPVDLSLPAGLGSRHWAAAAISKNTNAIAVVVSESNGTVRLFQNGEVVLRVEPFRRAMKWKSLQFEPPAPSGEPRS